MSRNVLVTVKAVRKDQAGETDIIELVSPGTYYCKHNNYYVIYKETSLTGMENTTTTLKVAGQTVIIIRNGNVNMRQVFELGKKHHSLYQTSLGSMEMSVKPWNIEAHLTDLGGSIKLEYELELDGAPLGSNSLEIVVKEV